MSLVCPYANSGKNNSDFCKKSTYIAFFLNSLSVNQFNLQQQGNFFVLKLTRRLQVLVVHAHSRSEIFFKKNSWKKIVKSNHHGRLRNYKNLYQMIQNSLPNDSPWKFEKDVLQTLVNIFLYIENKIRENDSFHFFLWNQFHEIFREIDFTKIFWPTVQKAGIMHDAFKGNIRKVKKFDCW